MQQTEQQFEGSELTYCYYSNFQLFDEPQKEELILSRRFSYKLRMLLGEEWKTHAQNSVFVLIDIKQYMTNEFVFDTLLVAWLQFLKKYDEQDEDEGQKQFDTIARIKFNEFELDEIFFRPVMDGFFFSASQTWQKLKQMNDHNQITRTSTPEEENYQAIQPLALVTKRIMNYLIPEKRICLASRMERLQIDDEETQQEKEKENQKTLLRPLNKLKKVSKLYEKMMKQQLVQTTYHYLGSLLNKTQHTYQVAQSFVMSIIEVNQNHLAQISTNTKEIVKVRLLQPAQGFYNDLMEAWILFRQQNGQNMQFNSYLQTVKSLQGSQWNEKYVGPTQFFFNTVASEWKQLNSKPSDNLQDEEKKFKLLFVNVKNQLKVYWDKEIVEKASAINTKLQQKQY